jgi:hypothetical protein
VLHGRRGNRLVSTREVAHDLENTRIQPDVFGRPARNHERVVAFRLNIVKRGI